MVGSRRRGKTDLCLREKRHIVKKLIICKEKPMSELSHIDPRSAALLVMDYQVDTLARFMTAAQSADAIAHVPKLIAGAVGGLFQSGSKFGESESGANFSLILISE
jgi:hypothetical protein